MRQRGQGNIVARDPALARRGAADIGVEVLGQHAPKLLNVLQL